MAAQAELAVIGGSGLYALLDGVEHVVDTPYGEPSGPITVAEVGGRRVAFLPRHGRDHRYPPHLIPYRANLWALRSLGVRQVLAPCAVGGLRPELGPGTLVVPDQLIDRTSGRTQTYYDRGAVHVSFADRYCPELRKAALSSSAIDGGIGSSAKNASPQWTNRSGARASSAAKAGIPPRAGSIPQPWPLVSPDHASTTSRPPASSGGVPKEPTAHGDVSNAAR